MASVSVWYDREGDFLEVIFEETPAVMDEMQEDIYERRSPDGRIVGIAVLNFSKHDRDKLKLPLEITATAPSE
jgi:uncharacterized protein YuzE